MTKIRNILIVPDKFKGSLSAAGVADALETAVRRQLVGGPEARVVKLPMADGGDGSMEVVEAALGGVCQRVLVDTVDALMRPVQAPILLFDDGRQAFIEMAKVCGLAMLSPEERNPEKTTTYGLGILIAAAAARGCHKIVVGIGGSATNDGGEGLLRALADKANNPTRGRTFLSPAGTRGLKRTCRSTRPAQIRCISERTQQSFTAIVGGAATDANHDLVAAAGSSCGNQNAEAIGCRLFGIAFFLCQHGQAADLRHFDKRLAAVIEQQDWCLNRTHQRIERIDQNPFTNSA